MDPFVSSAFIGAGSDLLGGLFGSKGNSDANKTNLKIARETNEQQYKMFQEANAFNLDMWNKMNEYNSPSAQLQRIRDAGLNPLYVGLDGTGNTNQFESITPPQLSMPQVTNSGLPMQAALANIGNIAADASLKRAQAKEIEKRTGMLDVQTELLKLQHSTQLELGPIQINQAKANLNLTAEQIKVQSASYESIIKSLEMVDKDYDLRLKQYNLDEWIALTDNAFKEKQFSAQQLQDAKQIAVAWYNARTQRELADCKVMLDTLEVTFLTDTYNDRVAGVKADTLQKAVAIDNANATNRLLQLDIKNEERNQDFEQTLGFFGDVIECITSFVPGTQYKNHHKRN